MRIVLFFLALSSAIYATDCLPVGGDRILASDLAAADRRFSGLPASEQIGYSPLPGASRIFPVNELQRIARSHGISAEGIREICFAVPLHPLDERSAITSMRRSLPVDANVQFVELSKTEVPDGKADFPLSSLEPSAVGSNGVQLWRGFIQYTATRRVAVWARVAITVTRTSVVAVQDLAPGVPVGKSFLRMETRSGPFQSESLAVRIEDVEGRVLKRQVKAGTEIPLALLEDAPAVRRGDTVRVEVQSGLAMLRFDAIAEANVRDGELADLRNPVTGKTFRARIAAGSKGATTKAVMILGSRATL
jgi:flagella basal body P-ring formation protein FlgA